MASLLLILRCKLQPSICCFVALKTSLSFSGLNITIGILFFEFLSYHVVIKVLIRSIEHFINSGRELLDIPSVKCFWVFVRDRFVLLLQTYSATHAIIWMTRQVFVEIGINETLAFLKRVYWFTFILKFSRMVHDSLGYWAHPRDYFMLWQLFNSRKFLMRFKQFIESDILLFLHISCNLFFCS